MDATEMARYQEVLARHGDSLRQVCITWCRAGGEGHLAAALAADLSTAQPRTISQAAEEADAQYGRCGRGGTVVVGGLSSWLITIESSDWAGATSVDRLSENGEAIALTINDTMLHYSLFYARDGDLQCRLRWLDGPAGDITFLERHLTDLPMMLDTVPASEEDSERNASQVSSDVWKVYAFMLAERITGVRLTADWLDREHTRYLRISNR